MQRDLRDQLFRPELVKRIVIYSLLTLILGSAQCSFFPALSICPATPDLVMGMLLAVLLIATIVMFFIVQQLFLVDMLIPSLALVALGSIVAAFVVVYNQNQEKFYFS